MVGSNSLYGLYGSCMTL